VIFGKFVSGSQHGMDYIIIGRPFYAKRRIGYIVVY